MVSGTVHRAARLDSTFSALSDPTRRAILSRLGDGAATVGELAEPFPISLPAISKHLKILENAGLISRLKEGRIHRLRLRAEPMKQAAEWMAEYRRFWEGSLENLERYLQNEESKAVQKNAKKSGPRRKGKTARG